MQIKYLRMKICCQFDSRDFHFSEFNVFMNTFLAEGHSVLYDREAPFELRIQDPNNGPQEVGTLEAIRVKILVLVSLFNN